MKKIHNIITILLLSALALPVSAQQIYNGQINITSGRMERVGNMVNVNMTVDMSSLDLSRNNSVVLTPIIASAQQQIELPEIVINGSTRQKVYDRSEALGGPEYHIPAYTVVKFDNNMRGQLNYQHSVSYESWMDNAHMDIRGDLCGCGGSDQQIALERVTNGLVSNATPMNPQLDYIQPEVETVKNRSQECESFLDFQVNKTVILPDYMGNPTELPKIEKMINAIKADNDLTINRIRIIGYASPEGDIANNERLSQGRAEAFRTYVTSRVNLPSSIFYVEYGGENWYGLQMAVQASSMSNKDAILDIIENTDNVISRKNKLKSLNGGVPYRQMLTEIYPKLRKVIARAEYTVKDFNVDEAKTKIVTEPQHLSLEEMFRVANTYQVGSKDFTDVFNTAVRTYPDDKVANMNAAAAAMASNNLQDAETYLRKTDMNSPEYANNIGVLYYMKGDMKNAEASFTKAANSGSKAAQYNLREMRKSARDSAQY